MRFEFFSRSLLYVVRDNSKGIVKFKFKFKLKTLHTSTRAEIPSVVGPPLSKVKYILPVPSPNNINSVTHTASNNNYTIRADSLKSFGTDG